MEKENKFKGMNVFIIGVLVVTIIILVAYIVITSSKNKNVASYNKQTENAGIVQQTQSERIATNNVISENSSKKNQELKKNHTVTHNIGGEYDSLISLKIDNIEIIKKIEEKDGKIDFVSKVIDNKENDFVIINIACDAPDGPTYWLLYIFDYSGNILFKTDVENDNLTYFGEYKFNSNKGILQYVKQREYNESAGGYYLPEFGLENSSIGISELLTMEKNKLENLDKIVVYEIIYQKNGKFSTPNRISTIKFNSKNIYETYDSYEKKILE